MAIERPDTIWPWLRFIEGRERSLHAQESFVVAAENQVEFNAVYPICVQAFRYAGAYVLLYRAGRSREAVAVARQALEHARTSLWARYNDTGQGQLIDG